MSEYFHAEMTHEEFGKLFMQYKPRFVVIAMSYVRDTMVAEDIVTDSFLSLWEKLGKLAEYSNVEAYILRSVKNRCLNWLRDQRSRQKIHNEILSSEQRLLDANIRSLESAAQNKLITSEVEEIINESIESFPQLTREVFTLSRYAYKTYGEIAGELGITIRRVEYEMKKALDSMRDRLKDYI